MTAEGNEVTHNVFVTQRFEVFTDSKLASVSDATRTMAVSDLPGSRRYQGGVAPLQQPCNRCTG